MSIGSARRRSFPGSASATLKREGLETEDLEVRVEPKRHRGILPDKDVVLAPANSVKFPGTSTEKLRPNRAVLHVFQVTEVVIVSLATMEEIRPTHWWRVFPGSA